MKSKIPAWLALISDALFVSWGLCIAFIDFKGSGEAAAWVAFQLLAAATIITTIGAMLPDE